ncbi:hypothetical protein EJ04DRAFT_455576 [Polyplosphaeria fusca]|uniref:DUF7707 domain-containing protein n=1 Tax=Polyplosphaeria fusca TaxID=682080 RepID=A0A9P4RBQ4_9PLEO|nr:hypothetical protein EJ04DRAFT_455576 [Polyplosphaeria fusca]
MLYSMLLVAAAAFTGLVSAQNATFANGPCCSVDVSGLNSTVRGDFCQAQQNTCREICQEASTTRFKNNTCAVETLQFNCTCGDNSTPNMSDYQQTVPGQLCLLWFADCIEASGQNLEAQETCKSVQCGNKTTEGGDSSSSSSATGGPTGSATTGGNGGQASATNEAQSSSSSAAATALAIAREYGTPLLAGGFAALFGLAL